MASMLYQLFWSLIGGVAAISSRDEWLNEGADEQFASRGPVRGVVNSS